VASNDTFVLVDVSDPTTPNKKIQQQNILAAGGLLPDGSAGTPGLRFLSDTNVGLFRPATDTLAIATGGSERLRIDSSGRLGLGTSNPGAKLDITGEAAANSIAAHIKAGDGGATVGLIIDGDFDANDTLIKARSNATATPSDADTKFIVTGAGNVGIGTTSVETLLHLRSDSASAVDHLFLQNATGGAGSESRIAFSASTAGYSANRFSYIGATLTGAGQNGHNLVFATNANGGSETEKARIDSSGRLLVGTSSSTVAASLVVQGNSAGSASGQMYLQRTNTSPSSGNKLADLHYADSSGNIGASIATLCDGTWTAGSSHPGALVFSTTADGASSPTERMRILSKGDTGFYGTDDVVFLASDKAAGTSDNLILGRHSATGVFSGTTSFVVRTNGNVLNTNNSYGAISDIKLKENIVDANSQWDDLKAIQVRNYNFKEGQTHTQLGVVAQEVELVSPGLVNESPDRDEEGNDLGTVTKSVNYSVLYMKAVKALQEAMERIEVLEAKVNALEGN